MSNQLFALAGAARVEGDADARADHELAPGDPDRLLEREEQPLRDADGMGLVRSVDQERELVAADPVDLLLGAQRAEEDAAQTAQHLVAFDVAVTVVYVFELVHVEEREREPGAGFARARERLAQVLVEGAPVREARQGIPPGLGVRQREPDRYTHCEQREAEEADEVERLDRITMARNVVPALGERLPRHHHLISPHILRAQTGMGHMDEPRLRQSEHERAQGREESGQQSHTRTFSPVAPLSKVLQHQSGQQKCSLQAG